MALRLMQIFLPHESGTQLEDVLREREILGRWRDDEAERTVLHLLVPAEEAEPIMDEVEQCCSGVEGFHVVLYPVEATLPRLKPEPETEPEQAAESVA